MKIFFFPKIPPAIRVNRREYVNNPKFFANTIELRIIICAFCIETVDTKASNNKEDDANEDLCHGVSLKWDDDVEDIFCSATHKVNAILPKT